MFKSSAGYTGLPNSPHIGGGNLFLYGLSDFWALMFEDSALVERMLEQHSIQMADVYSRFIQMVSTISIDDIQAYTHSELRLITIRSSGSYVSGTTYTLPSGFVSCKYLMTRPLLPTHTLENDVHFSVDADAGTVTLFELLENTTIPYRDIIDPVTGIVTDREYALWASDVVYDEDLIYKYYGSMLGFKKSKTSAAEIYKDFIRGLMFLYMNGPIIRFMEQGISLALGVPIARETETILSIVPSIEDDSFIVVTPNNAYTIPYDIEPEFEPGDTIQMGEPLIRVAEISDHISDPDWWKDLPIPFGLVREIGGKVYGVDIPNQLIATDDPAAGPEAQEMYFLMDTYLKHHTFLTRLVWQTSIRSDTQQEILKLVSTARPTYTFSIRIWEIPLGREVLTLSDNRVSFHTDSDVTEVLGIDGSYLDRGVNIGEWVASTGYQPGDIVVPNYSVVGTEGLGIQLYCLSAGTSDVATPSWTSLSIGNIIGDGTAVWLVEAKTTSVNTNRDDSIFIHSNYNPASISVDEVAVTFRVPPLFHFPDNDTTLNANDSDLIPLYNCSIGELRNKLAMLNVFPGNCIPDVLAVSGFDGAYNYARPFTLNGVTYTESAFVRNYDAYVDTYGAGYYGLGHAPGKLGIPPDNGEAYRSYFPNTADITNNETLLVINALPGLYSVFWLKPGGVASFPTIYFPVPVYDPATLTQAPVAGTSYLTPAYGNMDLMFSNGHFTVNGGE